MARYTQESVERVRDAIDMGDLVGSRTEVRRSGATSLMALCPFHDERSPSFSVDTSKKVFFCFGCNESGSAIDFVMKTEGVDFKTAIELLADRYRIELELEEEDPRDAERRKRQGRLYELLDRTASYYERVLWDAPEAEEARTYLAGRGLTPEALKHFRVGYSPASWDKVVTASRRAGFSDGELHAAGLLGKNRTDRFRERIMFPLADVRGRVIGFGARAMANGRPPKYLNTSESELFTKGRIVYGAHHARVAAAKAGAVVVVEGYTDVIALWQAGFQNAVCVMGTSVTEDQIRALRRLAPVAHLALDADNAGQEAILRAARVAGSERLELRVLPLPEGLDPAELVQRDGADGVRALVERSMPFLRFRALRVLSKADTLSAEGKGRAIEEIAPILAEVPAGVMRNEIVQKVLNDLNIDVETLEAALGMARRRPPAPPTGPGGGARRPYTPQRGGGGPPRGAPPRPAPSSAAPTPGGRALPVDPFEHDPGPDHGAPPPDIPWGADGGDEDPGRFGPPPAAAAPRAAGVPYRAEPRRPGPSVTELLARTEQAERDFLRFCLALPGAGNDALQAVDIDEHFTSALTRRAAAHLRTHLHAPSQDIPEEDEELRSLIRELEARNTIEKPTAATLDAQRLQLEMRRVRRRMEHARDAGGAGTTDLARRLLELQAEFDAAMERAVEAG